jgi:hypothetical protein
MRELLQWAVAGYLSNPDAGHDELVDLVATGFPRPLADRAVAWLPIAFGRSILRGLVELPVVSDPMFVAAEALAADADGDAIRRIGLCSAEVNAVNAALHAGSNPADLVLSPPVLSFDTPEPAAGATGTEAAGILAELLAAHGASSLACEARIFPSTLTRATAQLQVDIVATCPAVLGERRVVESFAGWAGTIHEAVRTALDKFARASLHVLLATLAAEPADTSSQVEWETWGPFRACLGPLLRQWSSTTPVQFGPYIDEIRRRVLAAGLPADRAHWFRTFVAVDHTGVLKGHDALLDNAPWAPGSEALAGFPWPRPPEDQPYALRHLVMLVPTR